ncbi:uncharacterized protein PSFLO_00815 [Pseudozyma flocculosa]|nr:uncharacterized protein PSFLO_00815 [Pseudozyma flocculosa]
MAHHSHHGHTSEDVGSGQQYFNPAAMHSRGMNMEGGGHYGGMQLPPLGGNASGHGGGYGMGHPGLSHQSPRLLNQSPQQHSSPAPTLFGSSPGHPYGSHFQGQSHAMPSQLSHSQHSPNNSHAHVHGGHGAGSMPMYGGYGQSGQQHYSHVPGQAAHGGMGGMVGGAGSNPMMGAPSGGNSEQFNNFNQQQHYQQQYFHPGGVQGVASGQAAGNAAAAAAPAAVPAAKVKGEKRAKAPAASSRSKKGVSPNDEKPAKDRHHPYAVPAAAAAVAAPIPVMAEEKEAKPSASKKAKKEDAPKAPVLKSHLKPPKQAPSAWQIFFTEELQKIKAHSPGEKLNVAHVAKDAGQRYAALPQSAKQEFQRRSLEAKEVWEKEMEDWKSKLTPEDIRRENAFRTAQRKAGKSRKGNLKDPNAPKKPLSAYFLFLRAIRADPNMTQEVFEGESETTKQSVLAAAKWRSLSETEKQPYLDKAEQDKARYEHLRRDYEQLHGLEPTTSKSGGKGDDDDDDDDEDDDGDDL